MKEALFLSVWHPHRRAARPVATTTAPVLIGSQLPMAHAFSALITKHFIYVTIQYAHHLDPNRFSERA